MSVGTVMPNRKVLPKYSFSKKLEVWEVTACQRPLFLAIKWEDTRDIHIFSNDQSSVMVVHWQPWNSTNKQNLQQLRTT